MGEGKPSVLAAFLAVGYEDPQPRETGYTRIRCPVHDDGTPSAYITVEEERWGCHTCDISEDAIALIQREKNLGFREARDLAISISGGVGNSLRSVSGTRKSVSRASLWD